MDETLIQPIDSYIANEHSDQARAFLKQLIQNHPEFTDWDSLSAILVRDAERPLIEPLVLQKIQILREKGVTVIALTSMNTGKVGFYDRLEIWRYNHLKSLGFVGDFNDHEIVLSELKGQPVFFKGMLAADLEDKGQVLDAFLQEVHFHPTNIIAIDDDIAALQSIENFCQSQNIPFKSYLYQGHRTIPWNQEVISFQADYLLKNKKWLSDKEASRKLRDKPESL